MSVTKRAIDVVKTMADDLLRFIFFPECIVCEQPLARQELYFCERCRDLAMQTPNPICPMCRSEVAGTGKRSACKCKIPISLLWSCGVFDSFHRAVAHGLKYEGLLPLAGTAAEILADRIRGQQYTPRIDVIVPIPLHWTRRRQRGFNQSELIAKTLGEQLDLPVYSTLLERIRRTLDQTGLNARERVENMRGAFALGGRVDVSGMTLLLVDDVITTGATLFEAAKVLQEAGCRKVHAAVIAVAGVN